MGPEPSASRALRPPAWVYWLPAAAALLRWLSLPGWLWGPLALPAATLRVYGLERGSGFWADYLGGVVFWVASFSFLTHIHPSFPLVTALILGLWWPLEGWLYRRVRRWQPAALAGPFALAALEYARYHVPLSGIPWASWSLGLADLQPVRWLAGALGEHGMTLLVLFFGCWPLTWRQPGAGWFRLPALALLGFAVLSRPFAAAPTELASLRTVAVQPNLTTSEKNAVRGELAVFRSNLQVAEAGIPPGAELDLLVWGETMFQVPTLPPAGDGVLRLPRRGGGPPEQMDAELARRYQRQFAAVPGFWLAPGGYFLAGAHFYQPVPAGDPTALSPRSSQALLFDRDGVLLDWRPKSKLVPIGESLPWGGAFPGGRRLAFWIFQQFGLLPLFEIDSRPDPLLLARPGEGAASGVRLGTAICWENVFEEVFRRQAARGAQAFCVLSNEAWYGIGAEMDQMVAATRYRAVETGRAILRATNSGLSVWVDAGGGLRDGLPRDSTGCLALDLPCTVPDHRTPYGDGGWLLFPATAAAGWVLALWPRRRRPAVPDPAPAA